MRDATMVLIADICRRNQSDRTQQNIDGPSWRRKSGRAFAVVKIGSAAMRAHDASDQPAASTQGKKKAELLALREAAFLKLEKLGFDARGKSPRQIREFMHRRRTNNQSSHPLPK